MKYWFGFTLAMAVASVGCGDGHIQTALDGSVARDSSVNVRDMGPFMFRDASTATCAESGENCLGLPCCGSLMCVVPANGGTPTCNGFLSDGGTTPDATVPIDAMVDAAIDAAVEMDAMIDAAEPDAAEPDAAAATESDIRLVVLAGESGDSYYLACDDDEDREAETSAPGTSPTGSITSGSRTCDIEVEGVFTLAESISLSIPETPGSFTVAHDGFESWVFIPEETTSAEDTLYTHFVNFYKGSSGVTFYDSTLNPHSGLVIGDAITDQGDFTADGHTLNLSQDISWHFGVSVDSDPEPEFWFELPEDTAFPSGGVPVVNFFLTGSTPETSLLYVQLAPGGAFLTLHPIFDETLSFRFAVLGRLSDGGLFQGTFGSATVEILCPGPEGDEVILANAPNTDYLPRNFRRIWAWPLLCDIRDSLTEEVLLSDFPVDTEGLGELEGSTLAVYIRGMAGEMSSSWSFTVPAIDIEEGQTVLNIVNLSDASASDGLAFLGMSDSFFAIYGSDQIELRSQSPVVVDTDELNGSEWFMIEVDSASYLYELPEADFTSGTYIFYVVDYPGGFFGPAIVVQLPPGSPEEFWTLYSVPT